MVCCLSLQENCLRTRFYSILMFVKLFLIRVLCSLRYFLVIMEISLCADYKMKSLKGSKDYLIFCKGLRHIKFRLELLKVKLFCINKIMIIFNYYEEISRNLFRIMQVIWLLDNIQKGLKYVNGCIGKLCLSWVILKF